MEGKSGVLAVAGDEGYPYAVPMSYVYYNGDLYFHSALSGHKLDAIAREEKVSFCVVAQDSVVPEKFTTRYQSAIAFGRACIVTDSEEKRQALMALVEKYAPDHIESSRHYLEADFNQTAVVKVTMEHLTGKSSV